MDPLAPIACSLEGDETRQRWHDWQALLGERRAAHQSPEELRLRFRGEARLRTELDRLVAAERECCGFVTWDLENHDDEVILSIRGEPTGVAAMAEAFHLNP